MCNTCELLASGRVITADDKVAMIAGNTAAPSVIITARQHASLSELPLDVQEQLFVTANQLSSVIFDSLGSHGTNILVDDAEHATYSVVGRSEEDGIDLRWKPGKMSREELERHAKRISEETWYIGKKEKKAQIVTELAPVSERSSTAAQRKNEEPRDVAADLQKHVKSGPKDEHNYLIKHLTRRR